MKILRCIFLILSILGLVGVRVLEEDLFYDPFLHYFRDPSAVFPSFEWGSLIVSYVFRFLLNAFFSGLIIYFLFKNWSWAKETLLLVSLVFILVFPIYLYCVYDQFRWGELVSFSLRRIVIQPVILLVIIPLFYYRNYLKK